MAEKGKRKRIQQQKNDLDRLSSLPDSILTHILSFLDTRSAITTSFLSKRYKLLWTMLPSLDFKLCDSHTESFKSYVDKFRNPIKKSSVASFERYVNTVLQQREHSNLTTFRVSLHKDVGLEFMQNCVDYAAQHRVQHLRIRGYFKLNPLVLPEMLLMSSSLITLHLHNATSCNIELPKLVHLPNLKVLRLKKFEFCDANFSGELFTGCPSLESLVLSKCWIRAGDKLRVLDVNCLNLKNLEIRYWRSPWRCFDEHLISVNAPRLVCFKFRGHVARMNFKEGLLCLDKACIDLCYPSSCTMVVDVFERKQKTSESFLSMLRQLSNVKFLSLSLKTIEVVSALSDLRVCAPCNFENLRFIKFTTEDKCIEKTIPVETIVQLLEKVVTDVMMFDVYKETKLAPECSKKHKNATTVLLPAHVMRFLLESSPAAEFLSIEIPKASSNGE
ncbi:hypothetical protein BUALT_Bualt08G0135500 [Buddleja alternifolia]|uniref:F-box domain-containing protein n=1 Tax=Buddleja alternifolia TaxID=168488 RepID=A0AAV6XH80_9LAMI|nr:hypothetical protein BUALT_Bualt08G0135500 [Buddleja alternifolia]